MPVCDEMRREPSQTALAIAEVLRETDLETLAEAVALANIATQHKLTLALALCKAEFVAAKVSEHSDV